MKRIILLLAGLLLSISAKAGIVVNPYSVGNLSGNPGVNATFIAIDPNWRGSSVLWNEDIKQYGADASLSGYSTIGSYSWGTGIWGRADWNTINLTNSVRPISSLTTIAPAVRFGNNCYNASYGTNLIQPLAGSSSPSECSNGELINNNLNNWTSRFTGYIAIQNAGEYNFSILSDDGFFFDLYGSNGNKNSLQLDYINSRTATNFSQNLILSEGLYMFELGAWDRLQAGIIDLRWKTPGTTEYSTIPTENLVTGISILGTLPLSLIAAFMGIIYSRKYFKL